MAETVHWIKLPNDVRVQVNQLLDNFLDGGLLSARIGPTIAGLEYQGLERTPARVDLRDAHQLILDKYFDRARPGNGFARGFIKIRGEKNGQELLVPVCEISSTNLALDLFEQEFDGFLPQINEELAKQGFAQIPMRRFSL